jgi:hypothetical protein
MGRDLHQRSYQVSQERRELLWQEMNRCLELADRIEAMTVEAGNDRSLVVVPGLVNKMTATLAKLPPLGAATEMSSFSRH